MRSEGSPLDLNNLPEDYIRDGKQVVVDDNSSGHRKKKSGGKDGKDESGKVYECRFCSLKFCKSQALGGHMNRHRQERETETLNRARQLVFSNDNLAAQAPPHLGCCHSMTPGSYHSAPASGVGGGDPTLPLRFPTRMFSGSSPSNLLPPQPHPAPPPPPPPSHQPYLYSSPSRPSSFPSYYPPQPSINDYYVGHVFGNSSQCSHQNVNYASSSVESNNYTCIGAPVGHAAFNGGGGREASGGGGGGGGRDGTVLQNHQEDQGVNWGRRYGGSQQQRLDVPSSINRFQDGF